MECDVNMLYCCNTPIISYQWICIIEIGSCQKDRKMNMIKVYLEAKKKGSNQINGSIVNKILLYKKGKVSWWLTAQK